MKTVRLVKNLMVIGLVLAAVTACGQKEKTAKFRGARTAGATSVPTNAALTSTSNYGILSGYSRADVVNFLGAQDGELGQIGSTGKTDSGVFIVGRLTYDSAGYLSSDSIVEIVVRDVGYQSKGGEYQADFTNCSDAVTRGSAVDITCSDSAGSLRISGTVSGGYFRGSSVTFTTSGFSGGSLGGFQMLQSAIISY